ncbi:MAG: hypothetical protein ACRDHG_09290, partial [Anaerolineales bacterium]
DQELVTQVADQGDRLVALEGQFSEVNTSVAGLSATLEQLVAAEESHAPRFDIAMAQFVADTAGFHGIAESLAAGDPIDPSALAAATRVHKILSSTEWPAELSEAVEHFLATLAEFQAALEADDAAAATPLAETVHDEQHELSEMIDGWLGTAAAGHGDEG